MLFVSTSFFWSVSFTNVNPVALILYSPHPVLRLHLDMEESLSFNPAYLVLHTAQTNPSSLLLFSVSGLVPPKHVGYMGHVWPCRAHES